MTRWLIILFLFISNTAQAQSNLSQPESFSFEHFAQENGLSQGSVYAIASFDGYMWFGTQDGLNRFDGYNFRISRANPDVKKSVNNSWIQGLLADSKGRFWVGTIRGLCLYDKENETFHRFNEVFKTSHFIDSVSIEKLAEDGFGNIWVMTDERGIFRIDSKDNTVHAYLPGNNKMYGFCVDPSGTLWLSTYDEIYYYDSKNKALKPFHIKEKLGKRLSTKSVIQAIFIDSKSNMWVGTYQEGVFLIKGRSEDAEIVHYVSGHSKTSLTSNEVRDFLEDYMGRIWLGTKGGGISIFDYKNENFIHLPGTDSRTASLGEDHVMSLFQDKQNIIWAGLSYRGIDKYDYKKHFFGHITHDANVLRSTSIYALYEKDDNLYIGSADRLSVYSLKNRQFNQQLGKLFSGTNFEVYRISEDSDKNLWIVTTDKGLFSFNPKKGFVSYSNSAGNDRMQYFLYTVTALKNTSEIWAGGHRGLVRFDLKSKHWKNWNDIPSIKAVSSYTIRMLYEDSAQNMWLGTLGHGLLLYNSKTKRITTFDNRNGLTCENIRSVLEDGKTLWIGTDCGLFKLDLNSLKVQAHYSEKTAIQFQLPNDVIYGILKDDEGFLWLSSNKGLAKFSPENGIVKTYDVTDGLQSNEFNTNVTYKHTDGNLYFGGVNGINYFNPKELKNNSFVPPLKITGVTVMDSTYSPNGEELVLRYDQNFIDFEFVALNFSNTQKNKYQYRMEGVDNKWILSGTKRYANYTKLAPGSYVFRVIGSNNDGLWNNVGASVKVTILPPWWGTWWFRVLLILLLTSGIYGLFRYRLAQQLSQREAEIRASLMAQEVERQRFSRELHDGLGANLSLLKMYLSAFGNPRVPIAELKERSEKLLAGSMDEIRRLIHDMHPRNLDELGLAGAVNEITNLVNLANRIKVSFQHRDLPDHLSETIEINIFRIIQELLQNAVKHSQAENVWLTLTCHRSRLSMTYRDDGKGFDPGKINFGNGLLNIRNRVSLLKGEVIVTSLEHQGTRVEIEINIG